MPIRLAAGIAAAALLCACGGPKSNGADHGATAPPAPASSATATGGPANSPVSRLGAAGEIPLDAGQRAQLEAAVAKVPAAARPRLRYALPPGDDGKPLLVVYDGEGLGKDGRHPGRPHEYVVFRVLNATNGEHYDPQQNAVVAPIPPPPQREGAVTP